LRSGGRLAGNESERIAGDGVRICVIDGRGGGIGSLVVRRIKEEWGDTVEVLALGTNAFATANMMKARANRGASGENAILVSIQEADVVIGPLSIVFANAVMGDVTPAMAAAIASCRARKLLLPLNQENVKVVGVSPEPLPHMVEELITIHLKEFLKNVRSECLLDKEGWRGGTVARRGGCG
jgi:hypothetical protein